jgi:hypothetical protein
MTTTISDQRVWVLTERVKGTDTIAGIALTMADKDAWMSSHYAAGDCRSAIPYMVLTATDGPVRVK